MTQDDEPDSDRIQKNLLPYTNVIIASSLLLFKFIFLFNGVQQPRSSSGRLGIRGPDIILTVE